MAHTVRVVFLFQPRRGLMIWFVSDGTFTLCAQSGTWVRESLVPTSHVPRCEDGRRDGTHSVGECNGPFWTAEGEFLES